jgi:hypothetical protein
MRTNWKKATLGKSSTNWREMMNLQGAKGHGERKGKENKVDYYRPS